MDKEELVNRTGIQLTAPSKILKIQEDSQLYPITDKNLNPGVYGVLVTKGGESGESNTIELNTQPINKSWFGLDKVENFSTVTSLNKGIRSESSVPTAKAIYNLIANPVELKTENVHIYLKELKWHISPVTYEIEPYTGFSLSDVTFSGEGVDDLTFDKTTGTLSFIKTSSNKAKITVIAKK